MSDSSSDTPLPPATPAANSFSLILALGLIAMMSGLLVVMTYQYTLPIIQKNKQAALEEAVFAVLPEASAKKNFLLEEGGMVEIPDEEAEHANVFAGYDDEGNLSGLAMEGSARGYQDVVRVLYGYSLKDQTVIGMTVLQSTETPGLGDKVETDPDFLDNFIALDASLNEDGTALKNEIITVKNGKKTDPWQIDGISGATVTSVAVGDAISESTHRLLPLLARYESVIPRKIQR